MKEHLSIPAIKSAIRPLTDCIHFSKKRSAEHLFNRPDLEILSFSEAEVLLKLLKIDPASGPGTVEIPSIVFKDCASALSGPLTSI